MKLNWGRVMLKPNVGANGTDLGISQLRLENQLCLTMVSDCVILGKVLNVSVPVASSTK